MSVSPSPSPTASVKMAAMERALDVSNYSGRFGAEAVACWRSLGYSHIVCGTQRPEVTRAQLATAIAGDMTADAYVFLYWDLPLGDQVRAALAAVAGLPVGRLWLDCEETMEGRSPAEIVALIGEAVAAAGDFPCGIYTGRWWWLPSTGDTAAFSYLPLWHAEWTASPDLLPDLDRFRPYGGWSRPLLWQFQGTTQLCGVGVDLNLREATPPAPARPLAGEGERQELEMLRAERRFLKALIDGRYRFRPLPAPVAMVEMLQLQGESLVPLDPPCVLRVD